MEDASQQVSAAEEDELIEDLTWHFENSISLELDVFELRNGLWNGQ